MIPFLNLPANFRERAEEASSGVTHCTWDPKGPGVIRLHLVPPKPGLRRRPSLLFINGTYIVPVHHGWAALLRSFMNELNSAYVPGEELDEAGIKSVLEKVSAHMQVLYPGVKREIFMDQLGKFQNIIRRIAKGEPVPELDGIGMSLAQYAPYMPAPHRMDLAVKAMRVDGKWQCPLCCGPCYAAIGEAMQVDVGEELSTSEWFTVLDKLWQAGVPQVSFTGGEPLERKDIVELVGYAEQFITRLNTSAVLLTGELAQRLYQASLDVVQVTVYSHISEIHDKCVGREGAWERTMRGIRHALDAGLQVSVNTPLIPANAPDYTETIAFLSKRGLCYFTCSSVLPAGKAKDMIAAGEVLTREKLFAVVSRAKKYSNDHGLELDFTSPGWLTEEQLADLGMNMSVCGACLGNMAIAPNGEVLPCQSWVQSKRALGNILTTPWSRIWNHPMCKKVRKQAALKNVCPLAEEV